MSILLDEAGDSLTKLEQSMDAWFNGAMDRVAGWYKKRTQSTVLILAALICILANADTITIATALANNTAVRESIVAQAKVFAENNKAQTAMKPEDIEAQVKNLQKVGVPLGWASPPWESLAFPLGWLNKIAGLALTTFAVSLGAPFWFDLLNKFMNIRSAGKAPDEKQK
jgi:hypothetical protein